MLKRIIEEHLQKEILDIDEISNIAADDILKFDPSKMTQHGVLLRASRNKLYSDSQKSYYDDRYKRLYYLANDFGLDYQPRVMVFLEGKTEETVLPILFELYLGNKPENYGIEFVNIGGISKFFGPGISIRGPDKKPPKTFISNFNHLVNYNLNKWQIIPFFIGDAENDITSLLKSKGAILFNDERYPFPEDWQFVWGITNNNQPFVGKDFEMACFNDDEISLALSETLSKQILARQVKEKRDTGEGLKQIDPDVEKYKIKVAEKLCQNLIEKYKTERNNAVFERPVFKAIDRIANLAVLNHPPVSREIEIENKKYIQAQMLRNEPK
jgi:hypothetical protein